MPRRTKSAKLEDENAAKEADARISGAKAWKDYTPYELRNASALARLGRVEDAHRLLAWFFTHQRPAGWLGWAEVVLADAREPRFSARVRGLAAVRH